MTKFIFFIVIAPFLLAATRIINGDPASKKDPAYWMTVRLLTYSPIHEAWFPECTATVLGPDLILTAAHCVQNRVLSNIRIGYEVQPLSFQSQSNPQTRVDVLTKFKTSAIENYILHPRFNLSAYDHDMALIRIHGLVPEGFKPAQLLPAEQMAQIEEGKSYQVDLYGYGVFSEYPEVESQVLRKTRVDAIFQDRHLITDQTKGSGGCSGDSGGPAFYVLGGVSYLVGVTHGATIESENCQQQGVWGNPALELEFLNQAADQLGSARRF